MPASGWRPTRQERGGAERHEDQVAGVGGDARQDPDEDEDEREQLSAATRRRACGSARAMSPPASATPAPISATNVTATTPKPAKLGTNEVKMKRMPSIESRPLDRDRDLLEVEAVVEDVAARGRCG